MPRYSKPMKRRVQKKRTSGTSSGRRRLQAKNLVTPEIQKAMRFITNAIPVGRAAYNLYNIATGSRRQRQRRRKGVVNLNPKPKPTSTGGYNQWSQRYEQATFGKLTPRKIDKMSLDNVRFVFQKVGPFNDNGQQYISNYNDGTTVTYKPLILFELNSINNFINGNLQYTCPAYQMYVNNTSGVVGFAVLSGQTNTGAVSSQWQLEKSSHTSASSQSYPLDNAIHQWSSLDLECWGQVQKPTKYSIMLCQFNEDVLPPDLTTQTPAQQVYGDLTGNPNASEFWQSLVKHYSYSPLAKMDDGFNVKKYKILKSYTFNIDPTANYENDPDPHVKTMKLFFRFNRQCNFQWKFANSGPQSAVQMNLPNWQQEDGENQCRVHPNARMFVMIRASDYTLKTAPTDTLTNVNTPSISYRLRSSYLINQ